MRHERETARPGLATTWEGKDPALLDRVLPLVDAIETTPDALARRRGDGAPSLAPEPLAAIVAAAGVVDVLVHGVGLSIGSASGWSEDYLGLLDELVATVPVRWHSEHLAYTRVDGEEVGTMLALPKTDEALELVCRRVERLRRRYDLPFLLENVVHVLPDYPGDYTEAAFLNELCRRSGCGLILDVYNLECDRHNHGFDVDAFLADLDLGRVREIHVACGVEHRGFLLDVHSRTLRESTLKLAREAVEGAGGAVEIVTYELLEEAVPVLGHETIAGELERLADALAGARLPAVSAA